MSRKTHGFGRIENFVDFLRSPEPATKIFFPPADRFTPHPPMNLLVARTLESYPRPTLERVVNSEPA